MKKLGEVDFVFLNKNSKAKKKIDDIALELEKIEKTIRKHETFCPHVLLEKKQENNLILNIVSFSLCNFRKSVGKRKSKRNIFVIAMHQMLLFCLPMLLLLGS